MIETILELRKEIEELEKEKRVIQSKINKKVVFLKSLEILTVNQLSMDFIEPKDKK